jgi:hypothetical protein
LTDFVLNSNDDIVEQHLCSYLRQLKKENELLLNWIKSGESIPTCPVCGKPIENVSVQRRLRPILWDSRECFQAKPRKIILLERQYGMDIVEVLKETTKRYGSIKAQSTALGISIPYFYSIIEKYCGKDIISFMAKYATGKRKETYQKKIDKLSK